MLLIRSQNLPLLIQPLPPSNAHRGYLVISFLLEHKVFTNSPIFSVTTLTPPQINSEQGILFKTTALGRFLPASVLICFVLK